MNKENCLGLLVVLVVGAVGFPKSYEENIPLFRFDNNYTYDRLEAAEKFRQDVAGRNILAYSFSYTTNSGFSNAQATSSLSLSEKSQKHKKLRSGGRQARLRNKASEIGSQSAWASVILDSHGSFQKVSVFPENPRMPNLEILSPVIPKNLTKYSISTRSRSFNTINNKVNQAQTVLNSNGKTNSLIVRNE